MGFLRELLNLCAKLNDYGIFNLLSVVIWSFTFIFTIRQLRNQKKEFVENKITIENQHIENKEITENNHKEMLNEQIKYNRISVMPYLILDKNIKFNLAYRKGFLGLTFQNKGNGTAIEIQGSFIETNTEDILLKYCFASTGIANYYYGTPFSMESDVARNSESCCMEMSRIPTGELNSPYDFDEVYFKVTFKDMYLNQYEQTFMFQFRENTKKAEYEVFRVESYTPRLLEKQAGGL